MRRTSLKNKCKKWNKDYEEKMNNIKEEMKLLKKTTKDLLHNKFKEIEDFKKWLWSEVEIKDIILQRHIKYSNVLKRELALSKSIIKNPKLL